MKRTKRLVLLLGSVMSIASVLADAQGKSKLDRYL